MQLDEFAATRLQPLLAFSRALTGDRALAEDIVQDVLVRLHQRPDTLDGVDNVEAYVRRMVVNSYISWRRKWFRVRPTEHLVLDDVREPAELITLRADLASRLRGLPARQRAVLVLRYYLDLPDDEIAAELGCSESTVRSHASRALATLRIDLAAETDIKENQR